MFLSRVRCIREELSAVFLSFEKSFSTSIKLYSVAIIFKKTGGKIYNKEMPRFTQSIEVRANGCKYWATIDPYIARTLITEVLALEMEEQGVEFVRREEVVDVAVDYNIVNVSIVGIVRIELQVNYCGEFVEALVIPDQLDLLVLGIDAIKNCGLQFVPPRNIFQKRKRAERRRAYRQRKLLNQKASL